MMTTARTKLLGIIAGIALAAGSAGAASITIVNGNFEAVPVPDWYWVPDWDEGGASYVASDAASYGWSAAGKVLYLDAGGWVSQNLGYNWSSTETFTLGIKGNQGYRAGGQFKIQLLQVDATVLWDSGTIPVFSTVSNFSWSIDASTFSGAGVTPGSQLNIRIDCLNATAYLDDLTLSTDLADVIAPTLASSNIVDNKSGGPVNPGELVTYTVTFSEAMSNSTVSASDFDNGGTAAILIGTPNTVGGVIYSIPVVATGPGTLQLRIPVGATMTDLAGNPLDTGSAILDNTTIDVVAKAIGVTGGDFEVPVISGQPADIPLWFDNTVTYADWHQATNAAVFGTSHGTQCALLQSFSGNKGYMYRSLGQLQDRTRTLDWSFDHVRYNPALRTTATGTADMRFFYGVSVGIGDGADIDTLGFTQIGGTTNIPGVTTSDAYLSGSLDVSSVPVGSTIWIDFTHASGNEFMIDNISVTATILSAGTIFILQ